MVEFKVLSLGSMSFSFDVVMQLWHDAMAHKLHPKLWYVESFQFSRADLKPYFLAYLRFYGQFKYLLFQVNYARLLMRALAWIKAITLHPTKLQN